MVKTGARIAQSEKTDSKRSRISRGILHGLAIIFSWITRIMKQINNVKIMFNWEYPKAIV